MEGREEGRKAMCLSLELSYVLIPEVEKLMLC